MSKISYPQLVKNLADAYRAVIGSTEPIIVGELTAKITEAMNNSGIGVEYKSITYNEDNTVTLVDKDDVEHIISCVYEDNKIISITYDNKAMNLTYDGDALIKINNKKLNLENVPTQPQNIQKTISCEVGVVEVILPVSVDPTTVEINSSNIEIETSVVVESEE